MRNKIVALLMTVMMVVAFMPTMAFAEDTEPVEPAATIDIAQTSITISHETYTGQTIIPNVLIMDGEKTLVKGTDYTVSASSEEGVDNINVSTATRKGKVTIVGKGDYSGSVSRSFNIMPREISGAIPFAVDDEEYNGSEFKPEPTLFYGMDYLVEGTDYTVGYSDNKNAGTAKIIVTGTGNYSGTKNIEFEILPRSINSDMASTDIDDIIYNGKNQEPTVYLIDNGKLLTKNTDFTLEFSDNKNAGRATIKVIGKNNYKDERYIYFNILPKSIESEITVDTITNQTYTGDNIIPEIVMKDGSTTLTAGTDYKASATAATTKIDNVNVSEGSVTGSVTISGVANYTGTLVKTFKIVPKDIDGEGIGTLIRPQLFTGDSVTPPVNVNYNGRTLVKGVDYTTAYINNIAIADSEDPVAPAVILTGMGNYTGFSTVNFSIVPQLDMADCDISISKQSYTGKAIKPTIKITNPAGDALRKGTDYTVTFSNNTSIGEATAKIKGKGSYTGTYYATFNIVPKKLTITSLKASSKAFTAKWKKNTKATAYQIRYSTSKSFSSYSTTTVTGYKNVSKKVSKLKGSKKYYVKMRAYRTVKGVKYYGYWTSVKTVTTKK